MSLIENQGGHVCVDCQQTAPQTEDSFTLISSRFGWRLELKLDRHGRPVPQWRCPSCWARHRDALRSAALGKG
jgi:hypothetical protein